MSDNGPPRSGGQVRADKQSVAAGGDVGAVVTGDRNAITHVYVLPSVGSPGSDTVPTELATRRIGVCHPLDLEVHHAIHLASAQEVLPTYVPREHDAHLQHIVEAARAGRSQLCVLVGESSTGKTRACWEAIQSLDTDGWRLWHPFDPTRADAAMAGLAAVGPKTPFHLA
ncbi:ATP-binding protein [Streptomyces triticagri]|uniref:ATP-binding protein n=1 Tax=Streptomyces triticagri TaxID=2293568 RepID=UPI0018F50A6A|nr:ATP-binding protein [Streptomyces triticagri]